MTNARKANSIDDSRIVAEIDVYQQLSREERSVARRKMLVEFPELADDLSACLDGLELIDAFTPTVDGLVRQSIEQPQTENQTLGDFRIIREIGRGGMGIVYEAEQLSLSRTVALKVLPFASILNEKHRRRFHNEARAAASLEHPHIVPVHGTGTDRGVHYYAMRLIEGQSLAEVLSGLRGDSRESNFTSVSTQQADARIDTSPVAQLSTLMNDDSQAYFKTMAQLGIEAANAMQYAHDSGVVHRDIKPANLLVDGDGRLWITDFGLAQLESSDLTVSGDLMGTVRYMSPEQANQGGTVVDHRTDIYSLGVTLYELLTLSPALDGSDRQSMLRQLDESTPVELRKHDPRIPADLETVVLKAMAKHRDDRYDSAREMAEDLQRFVDKKPIRARRSSTGRHVSNWIRRHRRESALLGLLLCLLVLFAVGGAVVALNYASVAATERKARTDADSLNKDLLGLLSDTLGRVNEALEDAPYGRDIHEDLWDEIEEQYDFLLTLNPDDPEVRFQAGKGYRELAWVTGLRSEKRNSNRHLARSISLLEPLVREYPSNQEYRLQLAEAYRMEGTRQHELTRLQRATEIMEQLYDEDPNEPDHVGYLSACKVFLGSILRTHGELKEAQAHLERGVELAEMLNERWPDNHPKDRTYLAYSKAALAKVYLDSRQLDLAAQAYRDSLAAYGPIEELEYNLRYWIPYAKAIGELGKVLELQGRPDDAESCYFESLDNFERITRRYPGTSWAENLLGWMVQQTCAFLRSNGRGEDADAVIERFFYLRTSKTISARELNRFAHYAWASGRYDDATTIFQHLIARCRERSQNKVLAEVLADCPNVELRNIDEAIRLVTIAFDDRPDASEWLSIGVIKYRAEEYQNARSAFQQSIELSEGGSAFEFFFLAMANHRLGNYTSAIDWFDQGRDRVKSPGQAEHTRFYELQLLEAEARELFGVQTSVSDFTSTPKLSGER